MKVATRSVSPLEEIDKIRELVQSDELVKRCEFWRMVRKFTAQDPESTKEMMQKVLECLPKDVIERLNEELPMKIEDFIKMAGRPSRDLLWEFLYELIYSLVDLYKEYELKAQSIFTALRFLKRELLLTKELLDPLAYVRYRI